MTNLSFSHLQKIAKKWLSIGGKPEINIAALEPTLWKDKNKDITYLISSLKELGFIVKMTTNGSSLKRLHIALKKSNIDLLRVSWHSMDKEKYEKITFSKDYDTFFTGIKLSIESGLNISINRILLKPYIDDLSDHIDFIDENKLKIKFYDLYWTEKISTIFKKYYISPQDTIDHIMKEKNAIKIVEKKLYRRNRNKYILQNNGIVEYKISSKQHGRFIVCNECKLKKLCTEGFADYIRLYPNNHISLCLLKPELDVSILKNGEICYCQLEKLCVNQGINFHQFIKSQPLRLIVNTTCNYNCGFFDENISLCLKQARNIFTYPQRI